MLDGPLSILAMKFPSPAILLAFCAFKVIAQDTSLVEVKRAFDAAHIPTDIYLSFEPEVLLEVTFPEPGAKPIALHAGVQLPRNATAGPPKFNVIGCHSKGPFVVAVVDPDVPTHQNTSVAQIRHFLGGNFFLKSPKMSSLLTNTTPALGPFLQPTPRAGSDPHRYVFLLYDQPKGFNDQTLVTPTTDIRHFNISQFAEAVGLGQPIGGTFMFVGPDPTTV
ncbi:PEBP-like protein [Flammula alnicola]|nr:PEBP-like protein [Flammula alnicola]